MSLLFSSSFLLFFSSLLLFLLFLLFLTHIMAALARYTYYAAFSALLSAVSGYAMGEMPTATPTRGCGLPLADLLPADAPSLELVKKQFAKRLVKKSVTNICTEWTLEGTDSALYEGCGQTSISYNWITECFPYSQTQTGTAPVSQIYCAEEAPACGYYAFSDTVAPNSPNISELGGTNRGSYQVPPLTRSLRSVRQSGMTDLDMSGAPMSENFHHHELE
jgi:hypothetical protein